jgi:hypothetical protein
MNYPREIRRLFTSTIQNWLAQNRQGSTDPTYISYARMAQKYGHDPSNPPRIIMHVDLCWNLTELNTFLYHKSQLKNKIEKYVRDGYLSMTGTKLEQAQNVQRLGVSSLVNTNY